jgi:hypothetical protein
LQKWKVADRSRQRRVRFQLRNRCLLLGHLNPEGQCGARTHHRTVQFSKSVLLVRPNRSGCSAGP